MSEQCSVEMCKNSSRTQCQCCNKNFCRTHFIEHDNLPNVQLDSLADEINLLNDRLMAFNIDKLTDDSRQKLERWRAGCYRMIDDIFEKKCREIDQRVNEKIQQQRDEICKIRSTVTELIRKQETTMKDIDLLKVTINTVEEKINKMQQAYFRVVIRPLMIDDNLIHIKDMPQFDVSILSHPYTTIKRVGGNCPSFASNDRSFLIHQATDLCLTDRELTVIKRSQWNHGFIFDMCWSSTLARFFVVTEANVFIVNDVPMSIESIQIDQGHNWFSCTCSDTSLYLSTFGAGSSVVIFSLFPSIEFEKCWTSPVTCGKNQMIMNVVYANETLALMVANPRKEEKLIELRSSTTLERLWSLRLDVTYSIGLFGCCFLNHGDWLVWDTITLRLLHIAKDGKLQAKTDYNSNPCYVILFDDDQLAVSTPNGINFHKLKSQKT